MLEGLFQPMHLLIIVGIALLVLGPKKLPELGKGIGEGVRGFKAAMDPREEEKPSPTAGNAAAARVERVRRGGTNKCVPTGSAKL
jgi:sec-independent protein translocase protein TatA